MSARETDTARELNPRPAPLSSVAAVAVTVVVVLALAESEQVVVTWLALELTGLAVLCLGVVGRRRGYPLVGPSVAAIGVALCGVAVGGFLTEMTPFSDLLRLLPGLLGVAVLTAALLPVRGKGSRLLVKFGAGGLFTCVVLAGLFETADLPLLLGATVGSVLAWDAADNAVGVGTQLGRHARTWRLEVTHLLSTAVVGLAGILAVWGVRQVATTGLSLPAFAMVFLAALLLVGALRW